MSLSYPSLIIGGLIPAVFYGLSGVLAKSSTQAGISTAFYLGIIGISTILTAGGVYYFEPNRTISMRSAGFAFLVGFTWAIAAGGVAIALSKYKAPVAKLVPLYNMNTLVAVLLGLWMFSEWQDVNSLKLIVGAVLIIIGGSLVANS